MNQSVLFLAVLLATFACLGESKKQKTQKVIYVQKVPVAPRQLTEYELCKQECRIQRDSQTNKDRVEQLKQELEEAELLLAEHNKHVDAPEISQERAAAAGHAPTARKASRFDHLKMAANKIVESTSELKNAVIGGDEN